MNLVRDVMSHKILYVTREATVRTAVELVRAHQEEVIPIVEEGAVIGTLDTLDLTLFDGEVGVMEVCTQPALVIEADSPVSEAGRLMRRQHVRQVPVVHQGQLVGTLAARDLLRVWGQVNDHLTGLPVSHQLRDWISRHLTTGTEVVILFLDLDGFGAFNKQHGHVFGDRVLQRVADVLRDSVEAELDFACRFGGDEFCVATTRRLRDAQELAQRIRSSVEDIRLEEVPVKIGVSIGIAGGRRLALRPGLHTDSTLDDLITRASTASTDAKAGPEHILFYEGDGDGPAFSPHLPEGAEESACPRVVVQTVQIGQQGRSAEVTVRLRMGSELHEMSLTAPKNEVNRALATATAGCLQQFAPGIELEVDDTYEYSTPHGLPCVGATVNLLREGSAPERLIGASPIRDDPHRSYVNVVLDATNRRLAQFIEARRAEPAPSRPASLPAVRGKGRSES